MSGIVTSIKKSSNFSNQKPFAVVSFQRSAKSKFAQGGLDSSGSYSLTYNLQLIYPDMVDKDENFNAAEAYKLFKKELAVGTEEDVNLYDIPISEISDYEYLIIAATKREYRTMRPATYGSREDALRICKRSIERQLKTKTFLAPKTEKADAETSDDDDDE